MDNNDIITFPPPPGWIGSETAYEYSHPVIDYSAYHRHWQELHSAKTPTQDWFADWIARTPASCGCGEGIAAIIKRLPPRFDDWFAYSVDLHNAVNAKLGKQLVTLEDARSIWFPVWEFLTLDDLNAATLALAEKLPPIRGVAGVPVSGMLCAPILATLLHVPLYEASVEFGLRRCSRGRRGVTRKVDESLPLLIVDDTISSGQSLSELRGKLYGESNLIYAVAIAHPPSASKVDFYGRLYAEPHFLEWNLANAAYIRTLGAPNHSHGSGIMLDFDGVLCPDPAHYDEETEEGRKAYLQWIAEAPLGTFVPRMLAVPDIVSYRCEYTREASEAWLAKHGIKYERLHLWGNPAEKPAMQAASRTWEASHWKGKIYRESKCGLFVESDDRQSRDIADFANKPVLCWSSKNLIP